MPRDKDANARKARAKQLRETVQPLLNPPEPDDTGAARPQENIGDTKMRPGESPNAYVERRSREIARKKREAP